MNLRVALGRAVLAWGRTWRIDWRGEEHLEAARRGSPGGNVIYAFWHNALCILAYTHRHRDAAVLVSQHRDGEIIARILASFGYALVRGSSRRGGVEALFGLAKELERGRDVAITVDGPVGPRYSVHSGAALLARRSGRPIVPLVVTARHQAVLNTWDALRLALPFTRVCIHRGEPQWVPEGRDNASLQRAQQELGARLRSLSLEAELQAGRRIDLRDLHDRRRYWERVSERLDPPWALRALATLHAGARRLERRLRPRPQGRGQRPWVVGIGNLEAGGTGKTPCVIALAHALAERGAQLGVLTRGHGARLGWRHPVLFTSAREAEAADETRLLAEALPPRSVLVVSRDKRRGLELLAARTDLDVVLVDDAFQTAGLRVDRHLVLLDWENPLGNGHLLPAGRLREPSSALRRAHALLFTRARGDGVPRHPAWSHLETERCFLAREAVHGLSAPDGAQVEPQSLHGVGVVLLSGIGRPSAFEASAERAAERFGFEVRRIVRVGDHAPVDRWVERLKSKLPGIGCRFLVMTRKDFKRLRRRPTNDEPLLVLEQRLEVDAWGELLETLLPRSRYLRSSRSSPTETREPGSPRPS